MSSSAKSAALHSLRSPLKGVVLSLDDVPDPVFAGGTMGPGFAIDPLEDTLHAPCNGEVIQVARTAHAITLRDDSGAEWLLHIGLDTVDLGGQGFEVLVAQGERISAGDPLCKFDTDLLARRATALISPIVLTNGDTLALSRSPTLRVAAGTVVERGEEICTWEGEEGKGATAAPAGVVANRQERSVVIASASGLHARPAAKLRAIAGSYDVALRIVTDEGREADVQSLSALLNLALGRGDQVTLTATGERAAQALDAAASLLSTAEASVEASAEANAFAQTTPDARSLSGEESLPGLLSGLGASPGLAVGPLRRFELLLPEVPESGAGSAEEGRALDAAIAAVDDWLASAHERAQQQGEASEAEIFEAHRAWLMDPDLRAAADGAIASGKSAGQAWFEALEVEIIRLRDSANALLAARADDLRDLQRRVMAQFAESVSTTSDDIDGAILMAPTLTPSAFVEVADRIAGLCLANGGLTSHVSILARARGVPCVVAMGEALLEIASDRACLDADRGVLEFAPSEARLAEIEGQLEQQRAHLRAAQAAVDEPVITRDGHRLHVAANVASAREAEQAAEAGADGVGLMRSEFLFLESAVAPDLERQQREYLAAARAMEGKPVVVRLLDIGADKQLPYVSLPDAPNPALGERGIRLWSNLPELFDTQLDALIGACRQAPKDAAGRPALRIMLPMVTDVVELRWVKARLAARAEALGVEELPALGVMIEVPSAALAAATLAAEADFLSIGTNDLTQYTLAMDREVASLAARSDMLHPAVIRLIQLCLEGAAGRCPVGVCGAAAGDPLAAVVLAALGADELSVEPSRVATTKAALRDRDLAAVRALLPSMLTLDDASAVRARLVQALPAAADSTHSPTSTMTP
ncbi:phosphoenolpyruvate--protein phosphotransferase [Salinicola rhizosphaerae]|uniref:phosphoenolpyruvate--protein phosphotransferase n=1 Tax=Salinicola rhizosphaerae TaxID=1443141 RepID=A0ABQ3E9M9_9GAMM|nr:phosphoenolpyruvate--protein phosphotransferase [Salinicola rhizosphaerae]GHB27825.1 phosphoenolpyruvate--protein phosphotransferase [Salinicola rhizosphaerae]